MNKFYTVASALVVALVCVGLASANEVESEDVHEVGRSSLRLVSDEQLLEEVARRGHLRRPRQSVRPVRQQRFGAGAGAGAGAVAGVQASRDKFIGAGSSNRHTSNGSIEGQRGSSHSSRITGDLEAHNNEFDDVQGVSKHTEQSTSSGGLFNRGKTQTSTEVDGFRRTKAHLQGGHLRGELSRNDNENSSGRAEFGQETERKNGVIAGSHSGISAGAGAVAGAGAGLEEETITE